jgi:amidase
VRIPAANQGVYGLRPSVRIGYARVLIFRADWNYKSGRLPYLGVPVSTEGQEHVHSVIGPMARTLSTLTFVMKMVVDAQPWRLDPRCLPIPWREYQYQEVQSRPLVVGLLLDDGVVKVHPPIERALKEMEAKITAAGHEVVYWDPSGHQNLIDIMVSRPTYKRDIC